MNGGPRTVFAVDGYQVVVVLVEIIRAFFRLAWSDGQKGCDGCPAPVNCTLESFVTAPTPDAWKQYNVQIIQTGARRCTHSSSRFVTNLDFVTFPHRYDKASNAHRTSNDIFTTMKIWQLSFVASFFLEFLVLLIREMCQMPPQSRKGGTLYHTPWYPIELSASRYRWRIPRYQKWRDKNKMCHQNQKRFVVDSSNSRRLGNRSGIRAFFLLLLLSIALFGHSSRLFEWPRQQKLNTRTAKTG